jgi:hypothetical protein
VTRCSREGSDALPLGATASAESSPRSMDMPLLASAAAAAFLLTRFGLQQCSLTVGLSRALVTVQHLQLPAPVAHITTSCRLHMHAAPLCSPMRQEGVPVLHEGPGFEAHLGAAPNSAITGAISTGSKSGLVASGSGCKSAKHRQELSR